MLHQRNLRARLVVKRHRLVKYGKVARFLDISHRSKDKPAGIVIKTAAYIIVAMLCKRLILMITTSVRKLCGGDVDDSFTSPAWHLMHETHKVLIGITESHATSHTTLEETCRTGEIECNHTLILTPNVHHAVEPLIA